jgi:5-formyltetrahydrofolate cyclo-ligase
MTFHTVQAESDFSPDDFGIPAPREELPAAEATARTLCVLPGLAAGRDGSRLGYGGGFYDRFLATFAGITVFPIYDFLLFDTLPTEPFDRPVDILIAEKGE